MASIIVDDAWGSSEWGSDDKEAASVDVRALEGFEDKLSELMLGMSLQSVCRIIRPFPWVVF